MAAKDRKNPAFKAQILRDGGWVESRHCHDDDRRHHREKHMRWGTILTHRVINKMLCTPSCGEEFADGWAAERRHRCNHDTAVHTPTGT
jgi:hypothetical protein